MVFKTQFESPVVGVFSISGEEDGFHLHKLIQPKPAAKEKELQVNNGYVGYHGDSFYLLSDRHFPHIDKTSDSDDHFYAEECIPGSHIYPACLKGPYILGEEPKLIEQIVESSDRWTWTYVGIIMLLLSIPLFPLSFLPKFLEWYSNRKSSLPFYSDSKEPLIESPPFSLQTQTENIDKEITAEVVTVDERLKSEKEQAYPSPKESDMEEESIQSLISNTSQKSTFINTSGLKSLTVTEKILGYGSHGTVVLEGSFEGRPVAIKRMLADFYEVADHEVKMLQESDLHPNVVRYFFKEQSDGFMYIALEYCAGSICDFVTRKDIPEIHLLHNHVTYSSIFKQIMGGILHLHSLNIVHRDIKPQNILISQVRQNGKFKVMPRILISDFGLGKRLNDDQSSFHNTVIPGGGPAGTVGWRAPECLMASALLPGSSTDSSDGWKQSNGKPISDIKKAQTRITRAIDIFSAGCVFYYIASGGHHPFGERFSREINILKGNYRLQHLDSHKDCALLKDLIKIMVTKDPSKRFLSLT
jgi:hypothetical protein